MSRCPRSMFLYDLYCLLMMYLNEGGWTRAWDAEPLVFYNIVTTVSQVRAPNSTSDRYNASGACSPLQGPGIFLVYANHVPCLCQSFSEGEPLTRVSHASLAPIAVHTLAGCVDCIQGLESCDTPLKAVFRAPPCMLRLALND